MSLGNAELWGFSFDFVKELFGEGVFCVEGFHLFQKETRFFEVIGLYREPTHHPCVRIIFEASLQGINGSEACIFRRGKQNTSFEKVSVHRPR